MTEAAADNAIHTAAPAGAHDTDTHPGPHGKNHEVDGFFKDPYVDVDEWREIPVRHRYLHGGFKGTDTNFSVYLPPADRYQGRFFQHITPVPDSENLAQLDTGPHNKIAFATASGAYFLETNGGGTAGTPGGGADPTIAAYRANAAAAQYSRVLAGQVYGDHRPYGYAFGGSGGGFRTIGGAENTTGVWDGVVPYVIGSPMAIPNVFTVRMHAQRVLRNSLDRIVDALEPGGSGDMFAGLDPEEREALLEVTRMGFPPRSWFGHRTMGMHGFSALYAGLAMADPGYFDDFWTKPGYLGFEARPSLTRDRVQYRCRIGGLLRATELTAQGYVVEPLAGQSQGGVDDAWVGSSGRNDVPVAVRLERGPGKELLGAELLVESGAAAGARIALLTVAEDLAVFGPTDSAVLRQLRAGDEVKVDNSGFLASQTYHRHQVPGPDYPVWDQFRDTDGSPRYPQRPMLVGPLFAASTAGSVQNGRFDGKMIVVECLLDREAFPWQADWYRSKVQEQFGEETADKFRLWYVDNALHGDSEAQERPTHTVSYLGVLEQALLDLSAWVEQGVEPLASTSYDVVDGQVVVPPTAAERGGPQPVLSLLIDGQTCAEVAIGEEVTLSVAAELPAQAGSITAVEWNLDGHGGFPHKEAVAPSSSMDTSRTCSFPRPGIYFPAVRVTSQRQANTGTPFGRVQNVARVRVAVS
ncbi:hypothetical protein [Arthrobacter sp. P2b]|uniref:hypothetical protein n=1 Tax=Arthrobacter sp. P2b TaxID=1938741 RepID=UPI0009D20834|nr:hypothetical protein [Arthrobacter sp. P2b]SLJ91345.1 hypothetical protein SAMN06272721_101172 [Arthrobacter sp. P2b]